MAYCTVKSFLTVNRIKYIVNVYAVQSLQKRDVHPCGTYVKGRHFSSLTFLLTRQLTVGGRPNLLIHGRSLGYICFVTKVLSGHTTAASLPL